MNPLQTTIRVVFYGLQGFRRNIWLSLISVVTMTLVLMTISIFAMGNLIAKEQYRAFSDKIDYLVFIRDEASDADIQLFMTQVEGRTEVRSAIYVSKEDARSRFESEFADVSDLRGLISAESNPLPRSVEVKFTDVQKINEFDHFANEDKFKSIVFTTSYKDNRASIDNYLRVVNFIRVVGLVFSGTFIFVALIVILNTIRLAIHARRGEVEVMRLVGASPWFIRWPFVVEGALYGLLGAVTTAFLTWLMLSQAESLVRTSFSLGDSNVIALMFGTYLGLGVSTSVGGFVSYFSVIQLGVGVMLGVACSWIAVRRYLKEF